jgi:hydrogenase maturation protease
LSESRAGKILVLGLGNTILKDDGVGIYIVRELQKRLSSPEIDCVEASLAGFNLLDILHGYDKAVIIDAIDLGKEHTGKLMKFRLEDFKPTARLGVLHEINLPTAIAFGKRLGLPIPQQIIIYGIGVSDCYTFEEQCSPIVAERIPEIVDEIYNEICGLIKV